MYICINKIENRISFKIKNWYSLELLTPETVKLLGKNAENMLQHSTQNFKPWKYGLHIKIVNH